MIKPDDILKFWFEEIEPAQHWKKDDAFDREIEQRFGQLLQRAAQSELWHWRQISVDGNGNHQPCASGRLAEIIVLDQFSRNIYRDTPSAFAQDPLALALAQEAVALGCFEPLSAKQQAFMIMPYMHSESALIHQQAVPLFERIGNADTLNFELRHKEIIDKFNRYPHRNNILGRESTQEELEFLQQPGSGF